MALTVTDAFREFVGEVVNLPPEEVRLARESRDRLLSDLHGLAAGDAVPFLIPERHIPYGAFARGTKIRPLDDLDLMICLHGGSATFQEYHNRIEITVPADARPLQPFLFTGTRLLDSRKVLSGFALMLEGLPHFYLSEVKRNGEAVSLWLDNVTWHFDLVPSFCMQDGAGRNYLLMPDRYGHWKKTDPAVDNRRLSPLAVRHGPQVLQLIRLLKYWRRKFRMPDFTAYLLECLMLRFFEQTSLVISPLPDVALPYLLHYISGAIRNDLPDPKGLKANINHLNLEERKKVAERAELDTLKAVRARELDREQHVQAALRRWAEVFGEGFPGYG